MLSVGVLGKVQVGRGPLKCFPNKKGVRCQKTENENGMKTAREIPVIETR